jgi:hypothetical protein
MTAHPAYTLRPADRDIDRKIAGPDDIEAAFVLPRRRIA